MAGQLAWSLCSRNARPEKALVRRAQWRPHQLPRLRTGPDLTSMTRPPRAPSTGPQENGTPLLRHARYTAQHQGWFAPVRGERVRTRRGCLRSRGWRDASPLYRGTSAGNVPGPKMKSGMNELLVITGSYIMKCDVIGETVGDNGMRRNSREEGENSRRTGRAA